MPKVIRSPEEIEKVKESILEAALKLFLDEGFDNFSMRKLASKLGMTAANIYNYYSNRDELYLLIQTRGFDVLYARFDEIYKKKMEPFEKLKKFAEAYISFGTENSDYYDIMFSRNTPKYIDYIGTPAEPAAYREKQAALNVAAITEKLIRDVLRDDRRIGKMDPGFKTIQIWSALHGIVNLYNSRVVQEVSKKTDEIFKKIINELLMPFKTVYKK